MSPNPAPEPRAASWPRTHRSVAVPELTNEEFDRLRRLIHQQSGLSLSDSKKSLLVRRLRNRLTTLGLKSWREYLELVTSSPGDELGEMLDCVLTNETSFFRESLSTITRRARSIVPMVYRDAWSRQRVGSSRH